MAKLSAEENVTAAMALLMRLERHGIGPILANSGTDFPPIIEALSSAGRLGVAVPQALVMPHEHAALGMAHGRYFETGEVQAVMLHTNVGLANGVIGAINAATDHVPVIIMSGRTPLTEKDRHGARTVPIGWGQEMRDQTALIREAVKWDYELRYPEQIPELIDRAVAIASSTPRGPVYLGLPREVLCEPCPIAKATGHITMRPAAIEAGDGAIADLADRIAAARRPLIIAQRGAGSAAGFQALSAIAADWSMPVSHYWAVALAIPSDHPCFMGAALEPHISEADLILVIDSLAPWMPDIHRHREDATVVHLGPNPLYSRFPVRNFRADIAITGEVGPALVRLQAELKSRKPSRRRSLKGLSLPEPVLLTKAWVAREIGKKIADRDVTLLSELGAPLDRIGLTAHNSWRQEPHSGGLGWSFPAALGIKQAAPGKLVIATMGDGSYIFANPVACHLIAEGLQLSILVIILNNGEWGAVRHSVLGLYPDGDVKAANEVPLTSLRPSPDFTQIAGASRAFARKVTDAEEFRPALEAALAHVDADRGLALLDVHIRPD